MRKSAEIWYSFSRNFAQIEVLRENARKFDRTKISTNKVNCKILITLRVVSNDNLRRFFLLSSTSKISRPQEVGSHEQNDVPECELNASFNLNGKCIRGDVAESFFSGKGHSNSKKKFRGNFDERGVKRVLSNIKSIVL